MHTNTQKALSELEKRIVTGFYAENSFLPAERKLCDELGVGRGALQAIFKHLAAIGRVRIERARGVRVLPVGGRARLRRLLIVESADFSLSNSYEHLKLLDGIVRAADKAGVEATLMFFDGDTPTERLIERYSREEFQAVAVIENAGLVKMDQLIRYGIPVVVVNLETDDKLPAVQVDFRKVGRRAGQELLAQGHRVIGAIVGAREGFIFREMLAGLKGALAEEDLQLAPGHVVEMIRNAPTEEERLRELLTASNRPTAFFAARDWRAERLVKSCTALGIKVPEELSMISYDNMSWPEAESFGLTTISEPTAGMGEQAISLLQGWLATGEVPDRIIVPGELITRSSLHPPQTEQSV